MGVFSSTCSKTHLPVMNSMIAAHPEWCEVVVLGADGSVIRGQYDGYGRVQTPSGPVDVYDALSRGAMKWVLARFYDAKMDRFESLRKARREFGQGHFHDPAQVARWFEQKGFESYEAYEKAYWAAYR